MLMRCCFFLYFSFLFFNAVEHCVGMSKKIYGINIKCKKHTVVNFATTTTNDLMKGGGAEKRKFEHVSNILYGGERDVKKQCGAIDCDTVIERYFDQQNIFQFLKNKNIDGIIDIITKDVYPNQGMVSVDNYRHSIEKYICTKMEENDDFLTQVKCVTLFFSGGLFSSNPYFFENYSLFLNIDPNLRMWSVCNNILNFFQEEAGYYEQEISIVKDWMECYGINK